MSPEQLCPSHAVFSCFQASIFYNWQSQQLRFCRPFDGTFTEMVPSGTVVPWRAEIFQNEKDEETNARVFGKLLEVADEKTLRV
jgi:hypothetical protein